MTNGAPQLDCTIPRPGDIIAGKYVVDGSCGRGGLAVVLSAMHDALGQRVAIKLLLPEWAGDQGVIERFVREGRAASRIKSEHVVRIFDVGTLENGLPYLVLEYLEGHNLDDVLRMWGPLPVPTAIDWVLQAAEAIGEAHAYGIVHRDLKPGNLFLTRRADGSACVKVIDFGLSKVTDPRMQALEPKLTQPSDVMGSPHYMAPEQLRATCDADTRSDLWALGAVLYELLTGKPPFHGATMPEICATVLMEAPPPPSSLRASVPPPVEQAVLRCLEKDPGARFANAAELARAIAPFGTSLACASSVRIERVLAGGGPVSDISLLPPTPAETRPEEWPSSAYLPPRGGSSPRVLLGSFLLIAAAGAAALMGMHAYVHQGDPVPGVAAPMPPLVAAPRPAPPTATATPTPTATPIATPIAARPAPRVRPPRPPAPVRAPQPRARPVPHAYARPIRAAAAAAATALIPSLTAPPLVPPTPVPPPAPTPSPPPGDDLFDGRK